MEFILLISGVLGTQVHEDTVIAVLIVAARLHIAPDHPSARRFAELLVLLERDALAGGVCVG